MTNILEFTQTKNIIVQLNERLRVEGFDFKHRYLITYDFESILEKIPLIETQTGSLIIILCNEAYSNLSFFGNQYAWF